MLAPARQMPHLAMPKGISPDELVGHLTAIRHHGYPSPGIRPTSASLLPVMREQLTELLLFRQSQREAELWAELFMDLRRILQACDHDFQAHQFLHAQLGGMVTRHVLKL